MTEPIVTAEFALGSFLARWGKQIRYDLSASESATIPLSALLAMAGEEDARRWQDLELRYADPHGASWLRATIATRYQSLGPDQVICCAGAQEGLACVVRSILTPDDHAIVVLPVYQPSEHVVTAICPATGIALADDGKWSLDLRRVADAIRPDTKLVFTNFPNSPTGASIDRDTFAALVALCRHHGLWLVNDEVYRTTATDPGAAPPPVADLYERGVSVNSLSKGFGLPGLRAGWVACQDRALLARVLVAKSALSSCMATPNEVLAHIALQAEAQIVGRNNAIARANLQDLSGLYAAYPDVFEPACCDNLAFSSPRYLRDGDASGFAVRLMQEAGVLVLPWSLWHSPLAEIPANRVRISLSSPRTDAAVAAVGRYLGGISPS